MSKLIGYLLGAVGLIGTAIMSIPQLTTSIIPKLPLPPKIGSVKIDTIILGVSLFLVMIGVLLTMSSSSRSKQPSEVPIYQGKNIVGFRRIGKK